MTGLLHGIDRGHGAHTGPSADRRGARRATRARARLRRPHRSRHPHVPPARRAGAGPGRNGDRHRPRQLERHDRRRRARALPVAGHRRRDGPGRQHRDRRSADSGSSGSAGGSAADETSLATSIEVVAEQAVQDLRPEMVGVRDEPGTLTIGFTDIEASTDLAVALGDKAWFELVQEHQRDVARAGHRRRRPRRARTWATGSCSASAAPGRRCCARSASSATSRSGRARQPDRAFRSPHRPAHRRGARR